MEQVNPLPNPPTPPQTPTTPSVNSSSSKKPVLTIFLVVSVIILTSLNAYLFMKLQNQSKMPVASLAPIVQTSPTPTPDPTANFDQILSTFKFLE